MCVWVGEEKEERDPPTNTTQTHTNTHTHTCLEVHRGREDVLPQVIVEHIRQQPHQRVQPPELLGVPGLEQRQGRHGQAQALTPSSSSSSHSTLGPTITGSIRLHHRSSSSSNSSRRRCRRLLCLRLRLGHLHQPRLEEQRRRAGVSGPALAGEVGLELYTHTHTHTKRERGRENVCKCMCTQYMCMCVFCVQVCACKEARHRSYLRDEPAEVREPQPLVPVGHLCMCLCVCVCVCVCVCYVYTVVSRWENKQA